MFIKFVANWKSVLVFYFILFYDILDVGLVKYVKGVVLNIAKAPEVLQEIASKMLCNSEQFYTFRYLAISLIK